MQAALKLYVEITGDHTVKLPDEVPEGPAEIIVLVGRQVEHPVSAAKAEPRSPFRHKLTVDELLVRRVDAPPGTPRLTEEDIQRAIIAGALDGNV